MLEVHKAIKIIPLIALLLFSLVPLAAAQTENDDMKTSELWVSVLLVALVVINIILMGFPFAMVRLLFGLVSFTLAALTLSYSGIPLYPYIQLMTVLISLLGMWFAFRARE